MDAMEHIFSLAREDSSKLLEVHLECIMKENLMSLSNKFPLIPGSQRSISFCTTRLSHELQKMPSDADFDLTDPYSPPPRYNFLHDPHLKEYFQNPAMRKRLVDKGFVTPSGYVKCTLLEFNMFRQWIRKLKLDKIRQEMRREQEVEKDKLKEKQAKLLLLRDGELYNILRSREQQARELRERGIMRREADRQKYLKLQEIDRKRREKHREELRRQKDSIECQREKNLANKGVQKLEEEEKVKEHKIGILIKRNAERKQREKMLERRRHSYMEERERKLKENWKRRCSLSLTHLVEKRQQQEARRKEHIRNVERRASIVECQRRKSQAHHDACLKRIRNALEKQHQEAHVFLQKIKQKKLRELEAWKLQHAHMREALLQQPERILSYLNKAKDYAPHQRRRSRLSSLWDIQSTLKSDFGIQDNVVYSGVVFAERKYGTRHSIQLETMAEAAASRQLDESQQFQKLLSRLETEIALREKVHKVVFGLISNAQCIYDLERRFEIAREIPGYMQTLLDNAQRILSVSGTDDKDRVIQETVLSVCSVEALILQRTAKQIVSDAVSRARDEVQEKESRRHTANEIVTTAISSAWTKALSLGLDKIEKHGDTVSRSSAKEDISEKLAECAKHIMTAAILSALHNREETAVARHLAVEAVNAAKASLERLYGTRFEITEEQQDTQEAFQSLDDCAKYLTAQAILTGTRSVERTITKDDYLVIVARSLASNAVACAKASLEKFHELKIADENEVWVDSSNLPLDDSVSIFQLLESEYSDRAVQSLAKDAIQQAVASLEDLFDTKVGFHDNDDITARKIAASAILSVTGSEFERDKVDLTSVAKGLAGSVVDSVKASTDRLSISKPQSDATEESENLLEQAAKDVAEIAVDSATRSLEHLAMKREWNLISTTRRLVKDVLDSAKASLEKLYGIQIESKERITFLSQEPLYPYWNAEEHEEELKVAARVLALDALKSATASLERLQNAAIDMETTIKATAFEISKKLVDSSGHFSRQLEEEGLGIAARHLAYRAIESAANSLSKLNNNEVSLEDIVGSDSRLLQSAAKVATLSARTSLRELFDRGFVGGAELEEATGYFATHALVSAGTMLEKVKDSPTGDLDLEICKAASELASQAILSAEGSLNRLVKFDVPESTEEGKDYGQHNGCRGTLLWKVTMYVEGLVNKALRHLGTKGSNNISNEDPDKYEMITHDQAREADAEYGEKENYLYQREILVLKASRIVNLVVENVCEIVKAQKKDNTFTSINRLRFGNAQYSDNTVEERFPDRETYTPTSHFKTCGADTTVDSQENEQLGKILCTPPSQVDCGKVHSPNNDVVKQPSTEHPASSLSSTSVAPPEPQRLTSGSNTDLEALLSKKESVYDIIKKREGRASCDISPCASYVILPHLNPSECSLIASRVENYETMSDQKNAVSSVTNLPSLSPKGSFVASSTVEQVCQQKEQQSLPVASSSRLPNISSSTSKISSASAVNRSLCHLRRTSSELVKRSIPKPSIKTSKESPGLKSPPGRDLQSPCGSTGKVIPSSHTEDATSQRASRTAVFEKDSPRKLPHSQHITTTKKRLSPQSSLIKASMSFDKSSSFKSSSDKLKQHSHPSLLYGRSSTDKGVTTQTTRKGKISASQKTSLNRMLPGSSEKASVSSRGSKGLVGTSPRPSKEQVILSTKASIEKVSHSQGDERTTTVKARSSPSSSKGSVTRSSNENAALHPRGSKAKMLQYSHGSKEDAMVSLWASGGNIMQSSRGSFESVVKATSPRASKEKVTLSRGISEPKNTQPQHASSEHKVFSSSVPKEEVITHLVAKSDSSLSLGQTPCVTGEKRGSFHESTKAVSSCSTSAERTAEAPRPVEIVPSKLSMKIALGPEAVVSKDKVSGEFLSSTGKPAEEVSLASHQPDEISKKSHTGVQVTDASQIQDDMPELDRPAVNMGTPSDDPNPAKDVTNNKILKKISPSLERAVMDKRLTPEGAEAEITPASSVPNVLEERKIPGWDERQKSIPLLSEKAEKIIESERLQSSLSKTFSPVEENVTGQGSCPKAVMLAETRQEEFHISRKKPGDKEMPESHGGPYLAGGNIVQEKEEKDKESGDKISDALISQSKGVSHSEQESGRSTRSGEDAQSFQAYRKYGISRSVHDTLDDIVQKMLSSADEPSVAEAPRSTGRGSLVEIKRDGDSNFGGPGRFSRERRLPGRQISNTVMETMDFMLQTLSPSDERGPRHGSSGIKLTGSDIQVGCGEIPRAASSLERFAGRAPSAQDIICVYKMSPSPPKVPSPKRSRLVTASSHDSITIRATQSDSSISSSDKAADLKPQVSRAWLDEAKAASEDTSAKSQSPKRPHSSPTPSLHKRSSGGLSTLQSFEAVSTEKDKAVS